MRTRFSTVFARAAVCPLALALSAVSCIAEQSIPSAPVGALRFYIEGGTKAAPTLTSFGVPLIPLSLAPGVAAGKIAAVSTNTLTIRSAKLAPDTLSPTTTPCAVRILTGNAAGEWLPVKSNTADTLVVLYSDVRELGIAAGTDGDIAEVVRVHTLDSLFGSNTLMGGTNPADADTVYLGANVQDSYYFNTADKKWRRVNGSASLDAGGTIIPPQGLIQIARRGPSTAVVAVGRVAETPFRINVANAGNTFANAGTLGESTLATLAPQRCVSNWVSSQSPAFADKVALATASGWHPYFHDGANWIDAATSAGTIANNVVFPVGAPIMIIRPGDAAGFAKLVLPIPFAGLSVLKEQTR